MTMANLLCDNGRYRVQFRLKPNSARQSVGLGRQSEADAEAIRARIKVLVDAYRAQSPPDPSTATWAARLPDDLYGKLAETGLLVARDAAKKNAVPTLGPYIEQYIEKRKADTSPGTRTNYGQAKSYLVAYFGATRRMDQITEGDAEDFRLDLLLRLSDNTVRRVCGRAKQFFAAAVRHKLIAENPFCGFKCALVENRDRDRFVTREEAAAVLEGCPDAQWRLLFALARFGGLRVPSEPLGLRWGDVDWERARMTVRSPKTAREGKATRVVPLFPELRPYLEEVFDAAEPGEEFVITRYRERNSNLRTQLERIIRKAGLEPWEKTFQNLRATRATELVSEGWPEYKVCTWLGHTEAVAKRHYWQTTDDDYRRAAGNSSNPKLGPNSKPVQISVQQAGATGCNGMHDQETAKAGNPDAASGCIGLHSAALYPQNGGVTPTGFEPVLPA
jgi:integrase